MKKFGGKPAFCAFNLHPALPNKLAEQEQAATSCEYLDVSKKDPNFQSGEPFSFSSM
jgi:hypothetical protein